MSHRDTIAVTSETHRTERHQTSYLAAGPAGGPLLIFVHGWPELGHSWRHQLTTLAGLGFRCIAPDLRGYGRSTVYPTQADYAQRHIVADMIELIDGLGAETAVWVGHDWGSGVVWNVASHHPERCLAVASLCVPYYSIERGLDAALPLVDRDLYPESEFPAGQWEYMRFYEESFERATSMFEANVTNTVKTLFRKGDPAGVGQPSGTAFTRKNNGWFGPLEEAPELPIDTDVIEETDAEIYIESLSRNGFFGPDAIYMNHTPNAAYAAEAVNGGRLDMPVLFLHARYDAVCETMTSRLAEPMREHCTDLSEHVVDSGHWMAQERPADVSRHLVRWLSDRVPEAWGD